MANYHVANLLKTDHLLIDDALFRRNKWRFSYDEAREFFRGFSDVSFELDDPVEGIILFDGRQDWPRHSWAFGYLFAPSPAAIRAGAPPVVSASVLFEIGGSIHQPVVDIRRLGALFQPAARF